MKTLIRLLFRVLIGIVYAAYKAEGLNALLLIMPAKFIVPTLRRHGAQIGENVELHSPLIIHNASGQPGAHYANLDIADHCYLGRDVFLDLKEPIRLEPYVTISMRCTLITHTDLGHRPPDLLPLAPSSGPITLCGGAYLGAGVTILENIIVGRNAVIAAGAVVHRDVPDSTVVGGVPARELKRSS